MSDLISRSALVDTLENWIAECTDEYQLATLQAICDTVEGFQTAYNMDKVVEELEDYREEARQFGVSGMLTDIIEIIRKGGVE